jgi:hypothetical protein
MPIKRVAHKDQMVKKKSVNTVTSWVPSEFKEPDLLKAQREGFLIGGEQVIFPSTELIPKTPSGYRVMFLDFFSVVFLSLPMNFSMGFSLFTACSFTSSCQILSCTSPALSLSVNLSWGSSPIGFLSLFRLCPSVSLSKNPELGGAVVSVRTEAHYLEFSMAASVKGWKKKWFYIKDQKTSSSKKFGISPFDANKNLIKLTSWDSPPTEAEIEEIKPLLSRIQSLKSAAGGALTGTQLMAFFLQRRIQPLQSSCLKTLDVFWLGRSFLSVKGRPREKGSR